MRRPLRVGPLNAWDLFISGKVQLLARNTHTQINIVSALFTHKKNLRVSVEFIVSKRKWVTITNNNVSEQLNWTININNTPNILIV